MVSVRLANCLLEFGHSKNFSFVILSDTMPNFEYIFVIQFTSYLLTVVLSYLVSK